MSESHSGDHVVLAKGPHYLLSRFLLVATLTLPLVCGRAVSLRAQSLSVTNVSPNAPYGGAPSSVDPSGRVYTVVVDPTDDDILYADSIWAGVWRSTDGAKTWQQASEGLRTGVTVNERSLAIDGQNPKRLLYLTAPDDGRVGLSYGGLWVSLDSATTWQHVSLPNCPASNLARGSVTFASGQPFVASYCGIFTSRDPTLSTWQLLPRVPFPVGNGVTVYLTGPGAGSQALFACESSSVYRSLDLGASWSSAITLPGGCTGMAVAPLEEFQPSTVLVIHLTSGAPPPLEVTAVDFDTQTTQSLGFSTVSQVPGSGSGAGVVFTALRASAPAFNTQPGIKYDVYASDGCALYAYSPITLFGNPWNKLQGGGPNCNSGSSGIHVDPWSMTFPSSYDPEKGNCRAYAATDGGIFATNVAVFQPFGGCISGWTQAMSGLDIMYSGTMAGISQSQSKCPTSTSPCPALYLPTGDDDSWVTIDGGLTWNPFPDGLGDAGQVFVDPAIPTRVLAVRNNRFSLAVSPDGNPPTAGPFISLFQSQFASPIQPPNQAGLSQMMTLSTETPHAEGIYVTIQSPFRLALGTIAGCPMSSGCSANDSLAFSYQQDNAPLWTQLDVHPAFGPGQIGAVATSGGVTTPTVYVLTSSDIPYSTSLPGPGQIYQGQVLGNTVSKWHIHNWSPAFFGIVKAVSMFVNPYDPNELYATDLGDNTIKVSRDGGSSWQVSALQDIATHHGEFRVDCGFPVKSSTGSGFFAGTCSLSGMAFDREDPAIRVAATYPGGLALSRDGGAHWIELDVTDNLPQGFPDGVKVYRPIQIPQSAFYDPQVNPQTGYPSIYVSLVGRGAKRIDGPFSTLMSGGLVCVACSRLEGLTVVNAVLNNLPSPISMQLGADGLYRTNVLFNAAKTSELSFHFVIDGQSTPQIIHTLSAREVHSGVVACSALSLTESLSPREIQRDDQAKTWVRIEAHLNAKSNCGALPAIQLLSITSNETLQPGDIRGARFGTDDRVFELAATSNTTAGRVYTVTYEATDLFGKVTKSQGRVVVEGRQGKVTDLTGDE